MQSNVLWGKFFCFQKKVGPFRSPGGMVGENPCTQRKNLLRVIWIRTKIVYTACYKLLLCLESNAFSHTNSFASSNTNFVCNCYYNNRQDPYVLAIAKKKSFLQAFYTFLFFESNFFLLQSFSYTLSTFCSHILFKINWEQFLKTLSLKHKHRSKKFANTFSFKVKYKRNFLVK